MGGEVHVLENVNDFPAPGHGVAAAVFGQSGCGALLAVALIGVAKVDADAVQGST